MSSHESSHKLSVYRPDGGVLVKKKSSNFFYEMRELFVKLYESQKWIPQEFIFDKKTQCTPYYCRNQNDISSRQKLCPGKKVPNYLYCQEYKASKVQRPHCTEICH